MTSIGNYQKVTLKKIDGKPGKVYYPYAANQ